MSQNQHPIPADQLPVPGTPGRIGQATAVEQSRAVAEVVAAVQAAQQVPRSIAVARLSMRESCEILAFAETAFFAFPKGGSTVTGPSIHLAKELATCWRNVQYGVDEMRRDDEFGQSEMQAWAWDVQMNTRSSIKFINPHERDTRQGRKKLVDLRDIYENNANMGNRRLRQAIFSILPTWFKEEAVAICRNTLNAGDGRPLETRVEGAIRAFDGYGITQGRLEQKLGRASEKWTPFDLTQLKITLRSIERGEITIDEEFPQPRVTVEEITQQAASGSGVALEESPTAAGARPGSIPGTAAPLPDRDYAPDDPERPFTYADEPAEAPGSFS